MLDEAVEHGSQKCNGSESEYDPKARDTFTVFKLMAQYVLIRRIYKVSPKGKRKEPARLDSESLRRKTLMIKTYPGKSKLPSVQTRTFKRKEKKKSK
jgi:hypothetical protein